jgi:uncharacterized phosphosugar-binding protein
MFELYLARLHDVLRRIEAEEADNIRSAAAIVARALAAGGLVHAFGTGHSHMIAEEGFFRAGGIAALNPILDSRLSFFEGALTSSRVERTPGLAAEVIAREDVRPGDAAVIVSNSGRNAMPVEMAQLMRGRSVPVIAITSMPASPLAAIADVVVLNCVPPGDALLEVPGLETKIGPASTVAGAAILNSMVIEAVAQLTARGIAVPVFLSANLPHVTEERLHATLAQFAPRIRYYAD